jgi:tetratricopeptide (TPR) repeat protein
MTGDGELGSMAIAKAKELGDADPNMAFYEAQVLWHKGEHAAADTVFLKLLSEHAGQRDWLSGKAMTLAMLHKSKVAEAYAEEELKLAPEDINTAYNATTVYFILGSYAKALPLIENASQAAHGENDSSMLAMQRMVALHRLGRKGEAVALFEQMMEEANDNFQDVKQGIREANAGKLNELRAKFASDKQEGPSGPISNEVNKTMIEIFDAWIAKIRGDRPMKKKGRQE